MGTRVELTISAPWESDAEVRSDPSQVVIERTEESDLVTTMTGP